MESFIFTRPFTYELKGEGDKEELILDIDVSSTDPDLVDDIVSKACLESMQAQIKAGNVKFDLEHEAFRGDTHEEKELNKTKIPVGRMENPTIVERDRPSGLKALALNVKGIVNKFEGRYAKTKGNIVNRFLDAASIAFIPTQAHTEHKDGVTYRILDDVKLLNVALTGNPVNTAAQMREIVAKSMDALEEYKAAKKDNPELENMLEVKSVNKLKETGSDKEKRKLRKEAMSDSDSDSEEETKNPKEKYEKKSYQKDGAHAHTENEPLGLHNHPEIEERIKDEISWLHDRITNIWQEIRTENKEDAKVEVEEIKSNSLENLEKSKKEDKTMTEEIKQPEVAETQPEVTETPKVEETNEPLSEIKSFMEEMKSKMESMESEIKSLKEIDVKDVKAPETEVNSKAIQENVDVKDLKEVKSVAGLAELQ